MIPDIPESWDVSLRKDAGRDVKGDRNGGSHEFCFVIPDSLSND